EHRQQLLGETFHDRILLLSKKKPTAWTATTDKILLSAECGASQTGAGRAQDAGCRMRKRCFEAIDFKQQSKNVRRYAFGSEKAQFSAALGISAKSRHSRTLAGFKRGRIL